MADADNAPLCSHTRNRLAHRQPWRDKLIQKITNNLAAVSLDLFADNHQVRRELPRCQRTSEGVMVGDGDAVNPLAPTRSGKTFERN
jgi:hypothetical protein